MERAERKQWVASVRDHIAYRDSVLSWWSEDEMAGHVKEAVYQWVRRRLTPRVVLGLVRQAEKAHQKRQALLGHLRKIHKSCGTEKSGERLRP